MAERTLASASRKHGDLSDPSNLDKLFSHLKYVGNGNVWKKGDPYPYDVVSFEGVIRGDKHNSKLEHNKEVTIKTVDGLADWANISSNNLRSIMASPSYKDGYGTAKKARGLVDPHATEYNITVCHLLLAAYYKADANGKFPTKNGRNVDSFAQMLFLRSENKDPAYFTYDEFDGYRKDPRFADASGEITYQNLTMLRRIMMYAAQKAENSPLREMHYNVDQDPIWTLKGKKNIGGRKDEYLQPAEMVNGAIVGEYANFVNSINDVETLVLARLIFEGMSRVSSGLLMGKSNVDGKNYNCFMVPTQNKCAMFEPKIKKSKTGGKAPRYFADETIAFFTQYLKDYNRIGAWFPQSKDHYVTELRAAGFRAGIWNFKLVNKGDPLEPNEKIDISKPLRDGRFIVYRLVAINRRKKVSQDYSKMLVTEGIVTNSHIIGKHTGISVAGLHGFSLDNCAEQASTDPSTVRDWYHGTLGVGLLKVIRGERTYIPWNEYIRDVINPLFVKRYNALRRGAVQQDNATQAAQLLGSEEEAEE